MDDAYSKTVMLACAAVALVIFITGSFVVFKDNQTMLSKSNDSAFSQLRKEMD